MAGWLAFLRPVATLHPQERFLKTHTLIFALAFLVMAGGAGVRAARHDDDARASAIAGSRHVLYLHGRIVEQQGKDAVSPEYGRYMFDEIVSALGRTGAVVHAPVRSADSTTDRAAGDVAGLVDGLLAAGVAESDITIVGASIGSIIAMKASDRMQRGSLRFVLLGACNDWVRDELKPELHGHVLSIYEEGDPYGGSCRSVVASQPTVGEFEERALSTGLSHGFLYRPLPEWVTPTLAWSQSD
ncbi:hypothetical protein FZO89_12495 [Luteimonas viscosa]|uniref:Alpha/beta hydrolase family protein n=1 Tax=Luteimonas viscosa TaxID=1132694 RepID=A0A5D4XU42_9GAMM|nr:hypothetical protein [Luteimonas viscosa]TYT27011.1 hypothetical protein FZO89_12495 [Luteimonas viscosa]